jgi:hypothetical protein
MEDTPSRLLGWLRISLSTAKVYVLAVAIFVLQDSSDAAAYDIRAALLVSLITATLLLLAGGMVQIFTSGKSSAAFNICVGLLALFLLWLLVGSFG